MAIVDFALEKILLDHDDNAIRLVECFKYLNETHNVEDPVSQYNIFKQDYPSLRSLATEDFDKYEHEMYKRTRVIMYRILDNTLEAS